MSLIQQLKARAQAGRPVRVAVIGAGKFGSMYLSQAPRTPGIHLVAVVDLSPDRARASLARVGWDAPRCAAANLAEAARSGATFITDDAEATIASPHVDIVIDATGSPAAGIRHALLCCEHRKHIVMVNVEADVLAGPILARKGTVEVVSSIERDSRPVFRDLRWGVYVVFEAPSRYVMDCFEQYGLKTDSSGRYAAMYKPYHLIGLELGISVASIAVRNEATGATGDWRGDVAATAKRALKAGEKLDGEGGFTVYGKLIPTAMSLQRQALPIGLAHHLVLKRDIAAGQVVSWDDVDFDPTQQAVRVRREQEALFRQEMGL